MIVERLKALFLTEANAAQLDSRPTNPESDDAQAHTWQTAPMPDSAVAEPNAQQVGQLQLKLHYEQLARTDQPLPDFKNVGFRAYSQTGEDGILLYVFALIGMTNRRCVELCCGEGIQCNTANLIINHGWFGLLLDGDKAKLDKGRAFYRSCRDTYILPPKLVDAWITRDNINDIMRYHNFTGPIDLLSLDLDGNDYWIWKALDVIEPRVVILEYQSGWGPEPRVTQKYVEDFHTSNVKAPQGVPQNGASLGAFVALASAKGYRLVGCERHCFNAIFIRHGIGEEYLPEVPIESCFDNPMVDMQRAIMKEKGHLMPDMWEEV